MSSLRKTISANLGPTWSSTPAPTFSQGASASVSLSPHVSDPEGDEITFTSVGSAFPANVTINNTTKAIVYDGGGSAVTLSGAQVRATSLGGAADSLPFIITVNASGGGGSLAHGALYTISGSYGTRTVLRDIWDNCSGASVSALWNDASNMAYITPAALGEGIALPHSNITRYARGRVLAAGFQYNLWLSTVVSGFSLPSKVYCCAYRRNHPDWVFGTGSAAGGADNNYKKFTVSAGGSWFNNPYWYHDHTGQKGSKTSSWDNQFFASGGLGGLGTAYTGTQGGSGEQLLDEWYNWVKYEYVIGLGSSGQPLKFRVNNTTKQNLTNQNTANSANSNYAFSIGCYSRDNVADGSPVTAVHKRDVLLADVAMVVGADAFKRVMFTDNATYASSTICEFQPVVSWNGNVQVRVNKGALPSGTAHVHIFDANDASTYLGTVTLV